MIKGVNKQILEVTNPENPYFEKIIFFVKDDYKSANKEKLEQEAKTLQSVIQKPPKLRINKKTLLAVIVNSVLFTLASGAFIFLIGKLF